MDDYRLKPCPFCGGEAYFCTDGVDRVLRISCIVCKATIAGRYEFSGGMRRGRGYKKTRIPCAIDEKDWEDLRADLAVMWNSQGLTSGRIPIDGIEVM